MIHSRPFFPLINEYTFYEKRGNTMLKDFINDFSEVVREMIEGIVNAFPYHYEYLQDRNSVLYTQRRKNKVALVTGGGSGHECGSVRQSV